MQILHDVATFIFLITVLHYVRENVLFLTVFKYFVQVNLYLHSNFYMKCFRLHDGITELT